MNITFESVTPAEIYRAWPRERAYVRDRLSSVETDRLSGVVLDGQLCGIINIRASPGSKAELGYWLQPQSRDRGVMKAAVRKYVADISIPLVAKTYLWNVASIKVLQSAGFVFSHEANDVWKYWVRNQLTTK